MCWLAVQKVDHMVPEREEFMSLEEAALEWKIKDSDSYKIYVMLECLWRNLLFIFEDIEKEGHKKISGWQ